MRALAYTAASTLEFIEAPIPTVGVDQVLIRPAFTGLCGTDITIWHDRHPRATPPVILGHEFSGIVVQAPEGSELSAGDPVVVEPVVSCGACRECRTGSYNACPAMRLVGVDMDGSLSGLVVVDADKVLPVPAPVSLRDAAFTEPVAVVAHGFRRAGLDLDGETVFVSGGGPIGLLAGSLARAYGASVVIAEPNPFRRAAAERLGLTAVDPSDIEVTVTSAGVALAIEASGVPAGLDACVTACRPLATLVLLGLAKASATLDSNAVLGKELRLLGSRVYTTEDFAHALGLLAGGVIRPEEYISHTVSIDDVVEGGFERMAHGDPVVKIMVDHGLERREA